MSPTGTCAAEHGEGRNETPNYVLDTETETRAETETQGLALRTHEQRKECLFQVSLAGFYGETDGMG